MVESSFKRRKENLYTLVFYVSSGRSFKVGRVDSIKRKVYQVARRYDWKSVKVFNRRNGNFITQFRPGDMIPDFVRGYYFNN